MSIQVVCGTSSARCAAPSLRATIIRRRNRCDRHPWLWCKTAADIYE